MFVYKLQQSRNKDQQTDAEALLQNTKLKILIYKVYTRVTSCYFICKKIGVNKKLKKWTSSVKACREIKDKLLSHESELNL